MGQFIDLTGRRFGRLTVSHRAGNSSDNVVMWACKCDCGATATASRRELRKGDTKSCGCLSHETEDLRGRRYGRWSVLEREVSMGHGSRWLCRCDCGAERVVSGESLRRGRSKSCGCFHSDATRAQWTTHGHTCGGQTPEYQAWASIIGRCTLASSPAFRHYGGRGIKVCDRWRESFENFLADMGLRTGPKHSIDRIDVNGNYEPGNCRWATAKEQARNRRDNRVVSALGRSQCVAAWAEQTGLSVYCIRYRLDNGWPANDALTAPVGSRRPKEGRAA